MPAVFNKTIANLIEDMAVHMIIKAYKSIKKKFRSWASVTLSEWPALPDTHP